MKCVPNSFRGVRRTINDVARSVSLVDRETCPTGSDVALPSPVPLTKRLHSTVTLLSQTLKCANMALFTAQVHPGQALGFLGMPGLFESLRKLDRLLIRGPRSTRSFSPRYSHSTESRTAEISKAGPCIREHGTRQESGDSLSSKQWYSTTI